jgi:hypothetical protein
MVNESEEEELKRKMKNEQKEEWKKGSVSVKSVT